jgi:apolipoprotein N-acyltransferase
LVPIVGAYGVTYLLAALGAGTAAVSFDRGTPRIVAVVTILGALLMSAVAGMWRAPVMDQPGENLKVAVVQGGPQPGIGVQQARAVLQAHASRTRELAVRESSIDLVLWPESSTDIDPFVDPWARAQIDAAAKAVDAPVVVGAVTADPGDSERLRNQAIVWRPGEGAGVSYTKQRLVPFGEFVPARAVLERLSSRFSEIPRDFIEGNGSPMLPLDVVKLGVVICFEVAFDDRVRQAIEAGATMLAVPANNATYIGTGQAQQQLRIARFRALETARSVLVASTTGPSAIIGRDGLVTERLDEGVSGALVGEAAQNATVTPAVRLGPFISGFMVLLALASGVVAVQRVIRRGLPS